MSSLQTVCQLDKETPDVDAGELVLENSFQQSHRCMIRYNSMSASDYCISCSRSPCKSLKSPLLGRLRREEGVVFNVIGGNTSGRCYTYTMVKEKSQAVNQVRLPYASCLGDYQSQGRWMMNFSMFLHEDIARIGAAFLVDAEGQQLKVVNDCCPGAKR